MIEVLKLDELRRAYRYSQGDIADYLDTTNQTISNWENGKTEPDIESLKKLADMFHVSIDYLGGHNTKDISISDLRTRIHSSEREELILLLDKILKVITK